MSRDRRAKPVRRVYYIEDLQEVLGVSRNTVYRRLRDGRLLDPIVRGGRGASRLVWGADEVREWVRAGMPTAAAWRRQQAAARRQRRRGA